MKIKYPKLLLLLLSLILAYFLFHERNFLLFHEIILALGYGGFLIAGFFYAYGFTAAPATALFLVMTKGHNVLVAGLIGGLGALLSDLIIYVFIKTTFADEIKKLSKTKVIKLIKKEEKKLLGHFQIYVLPAFAGFFIASPFPTEMGVAILASLRKLSPWKFALLVYVLHTLGILIILSIGSLI